MLIDDPRAFLAQLYHAAVERALPMHCMAAYLPPPPKGKTLVLGAGKAGGAMAHALEALWPADAPLSGLGVARYPGAGPPVGFGRGRLPGPQRRPWLFFSPWGPVCDRANIYECERLPGHSGAVSTWRSALLTIGAGLPIGACPLQMFDIAQGMRGPTAAKSPT